MYLPFDGTISGDSLSSTDVNVQMEEVPGPGTVILFRRGRFIWQGSHQFSVGEQYHLQLNAGPFYDLTITELKPGGLVKFETAH